MPRVKGCDSFPLQVPAVFKCWAPMPKSLSAHELLPSSSLLTLTTVERTDAGWTVMAQGPDYARCPRGRQVSTARHSRYVRTLKDLPAVGATVSLHSRRSVAMQHPS